MSNTYHRAMGAAIALLATAALAVYAGNTYADTMPPAPATLISVSTEASSTSAAVSATTTATAANISWTTPDVASSQVSYGTSTTYTATTIGNLAINHNVLLQGLAPDTTYHFAVSSDDGTGVVTSPDQTFTTIASSSIPAPVLSQITVIPTYSIASILWMTDQPSDSAVWWGPAAGDYTASSTPDSTGPDEASTTEHLINIMGLTPGATYHFEVVSKNALGASATSSDQIFTTMLAPEAGTT